MQVDKCLKLLLYIDCPQTYILKSPKIAPLATANIPRDNRETCNNAEIAVKQTIFFNN